jgi:hypothetical protein
MDMLFPLAQSRGLVVAWNQQGPSEKGRQIMAFPLLRSSSLAAIAAFFVPQVAQANSSFEFYGQLNFGLFNTDDGADSETYFTDNDNFNSLVGFWWNNDLGGGRSLRFNFETSLGLQGSSAVTINDTDLDPDYSRTEIRFVDFIYDTPDIGQFRFGQGSMASDFAAGADLSGTDIIAYSGISDLAGNFEFRDPSGGFTGVRISDTFNNFDGARRFRVRYDTPEISGFVFSIAGGEEILNEDDDNEYYDIGATYSRDYGDVTVRARGGYAWVGGGEELIVGSFAALHEPSGISIALAAGAQQAVGDAETFYAKLGWQQNWLSYGRTAFSIDVNDGNDFAFDGSDTSSVGLAVVQHFDDERVEVYAVWRTHEFDAPGQSFDDVDTIALGARWRF